MGTCPLAPPSFQMSVVPGGEWVPVFVPPSLREEVGPRRAGIVRHPTTHIFPIPNLASSEKLPFSQFDRLPLPFHCSSCSNSAPARFPGTERQIKLVTTVCEQKPPAHKSQVSVQNNWASLVSARPASIFPEQFDSLWISHFDPLCLHFGDSDFGYGGARRWWMKNLEVFIEGSAMGLNSPSPLSSSLLLVLFFSSTLPFTSAYFADWSSFAERDRQPTCVDIPSNMTLCQNIGETIFLGSLWADMYVF